jgi:T-complex protein 1 subunit beta
MEEGKIDCMRQTSVTESYVVKRQVLRTASGAAKMILSVDDIIKAAPRRREVDRSYC